MLFELKERHYSAMKWLPMLPLLLLLFTLGARNLDIDAIWGDEHYSIYYAGLADRVPPDLDSVWERVTTVSAGQAPAYYMILNIWGRFVGSEPPVLRILSLFAALLTVALVFRLANDWLSREAAFISSTLLATSALIIFYAHELRAYALTFLLSVVLLHSYLRLVKRTGRMPWGSAIVFCVATVIALYTHYFAVVPLVMLGVYHLLFVPKTRRWWQITGLVMVAVLTFLPWLPIWITDLLEPSSLSTTAVTPDAILSILGTTMTYLSNNLAIVIGVAVVLAAFARPRKSLWLWLAAGGFVLMAFVTASMVIGHERIRYSAATWPSLLLLTGVGLASVWPYRVRQLAVGKIAVSIVVAVWVYPGWSTARLVLTPEPGLHQITGFLFTRLTGCFDLCFRDRILSSVCIPMIRISLSNAPMTSVISTFAIHLL
jgi:4-amino-4-deoxy-L-arabinose transferase-like glycosyltransferase